VSTIIRVDPDMSADRMVRMFNQQVSEDGTLTEAMKRAYHIKDSQKRHQKKREIEFRKRKGVTESATS
jgi:ribosomal protein S21